MHDKGKAGGSLRHRRRSRMKAAAKRSAAMTWSAAQYLKFEQ